MQAKTLSVRQQLWKNKVTVRQNWHFESCFTRIVFQSFTFGKVFTTKKSLMKKAIQLIACVALLFPTFSLSAQQFSNFPEKPTAGEVVRLSYDPNGGPLAGIPFDAVAYIYEAGTQEPTAVDINFTEEGGMFSAKLPITAAAQIILFSFANDDLEKKDDNAGTGYKIMVYKADHLTTVAGALGLKSMFYNGWGRSGGVKNDLERATNLAKQELTEYPDALSDARFATNFAGLAKKQNDEAMIAASKAQIEKLTKPKRASEEDLRTAASLAALLEEKGLAEAIKKRADDKYPNGSAAKAKANEDFKAAKTVADKVKIYTDAKSKFAKEKDMERNLSTWAASIASEYGKSEDWPNFEKYFSQITDPMRASGVLNGIAWPMSGASIEGESKNPTKGLELSARSLAILDEAAKNTVTRPGSTSPKKWQDNLDYAKAMYADTYALLLFKNGKNEEALKYQKLACEKNNFADAEMNERYAAFFEKANTPQATEALLTKLISEGKANTKMMEQHKRLFIANNTLETAYDKYVAGLEKEAKAKKRKEIEGQILDESAPSFSLRNLKGETVSLENLRGKVLVLDFWATWCGPCKASFPGMQTAVNKFENRKDVEFLFIDTWENVEDKAKAAGDYIASKSYSFNVLMDLDNAVVTKYGVSGIPTKFVVDKQGKIRFKAVGFSGNDQELVDEISTMIEIAAGEATP